MIITHKNFDEKLTKVICNILASITGVSLGIYLYLLLMSKCVRFNFDIITLGGVIIISVIFVLPVFVALSIFICIKIALYKFNETKSALLGRLIVGLLISFSSVCAKNILNLRKQSRRPGLASRPISFMGGTPIIYAMP